MVPNDKDPHGVAHDSIKEVVREASEVGPPEVRFKEMVSVRALDSVQHKAPQFAIEFLCQFRVLSPLVIV